MRTPFIFSRIAETVRANVSGTRNLLRDTGNRDGMSLEEVAHNVSAKEVLGAVETRALAGGAVVLSRIAENLSCTAESRFVGVSWRRR